MADKRQRSVALPVRRAAHDLGDHIASWRKLRGLTQAQLADRAGISEATLRRLEHGDPGVALGTVLATLRAVGVLDTVIAAADPYSTDVGRLRSGERLPQRVRPRDLTGGDG